MGTGYARYLYVPEDGTRYSSSVVARIEGALRDAGLGLGPDGEGTKWRPFRPGGALMEYTERIGLVYPTLKVDWYDEPHRVSDPFLPPRGPWSRCTDCDKIMPVSGIVFRGDDLVMLEQCTSCGAPFDANDWEPAQSRCIFESRLVISLTADAYASSLPSFGDGCPQVIRCVQELLDTKLHEVFVAW